MKKYFQTLFNTLKYVLLWYAITIIINLIFFRQKITDFVAAYQKVSAIYGSVGAILMAVLAILGLTVVLTGVIGTGIFIYQSLRKPNSKVS